MGTDNPTDPVDPTEPADPPAPAPKPPGSPDDVEAMRAALKKANAEAAENRRKLKELEDRDKTDGEKLSERAAAAERRAEEAESRAMRLEVAAAKGLTPGQAKRLVGSTREELEADADEIIAEFAPATPGGGDDHRSTPGGRPKERLRGGSDPTEEPEETDPRKLAEMIPRR